MSLHFIICTKEWKRDRKNTNKMERNTKCNNNINNTKERKTLIFISLSIKIYKNNNHLTV